MKKALSFRFSDEFVDILRTWSFVTGKEQRELLEEAFGEYMERNTEIKEKVEKIRSTMKE